MFGTVKRHLSAWDAQSAPLSDAWALACVGLLARIAVVLWAAERFPPAEDGHFYHVVASRIAEGHGYTWLWPDGAVTYAAHYPVGYPAMVGALYTLFGSEPVVAMAFNAVLGSAAVVAAHRIAATVAGRSTALVSALLVALHPGLVLYTPAVMTEGATAALLALAGGVAISSRPHSAPLRQVLLGVVLGLATLVRPQSLLLAPLFALLTEHRGASGWRRARGSLIASAVAIAVCLPWTLRNCDKMGRCVFVSANSGWNLLIGSAEHATGAWVPIDEVGFPEQCRTVFDEAQKDDCFRKAALDDIRESPTRYLGLIPRKLAATFDYGGAPGWYLHASNPQAFDGRDKVALGVIETVYERLVVLASLFVAGVCPGPRRRARFIVAAAGALFAVLEHGYVAHLGIALAAFMMGSALSTWPPLFLVAMSVAATAATHAVFFGAGRYSLVCYPLLGALAGLAFNRRGSAPLAPRGEL